MPESDEQQRGEVAFTNLDEPLFSGADATKRVLVEYLDAMSRRIVTELHDRPLSVIRVHRDQAPFMQKNVPAYTPSWVHTVRLWAETSKREVSYALCNDRPTLMWFANQRAVEYHPALYRVNRSPSPLYLILDLDPPSVEAFAAAVRTAHLVRQALSDVGIEGAVKTSGAKGVHVFVPVKRATFEDVAAAARSIAARTEQLDPSLATTAFVKEERRGRVFVDATRVGPGATVVAAYSPRARPGVPVSFPLSWDDLDRITPMDFSMRTVPSMLADRDPWLDHMPQPQTLPDELIDEGRAIPIARVQAMHEGLRKSRARRAAGD
ncbi:MAG: ATP-dependent DNA ligase [Candidatus Dormibacteraeota bacterium]|nr:ATP-dependent DNA ligase [Candidatus Dormibacteraeota bacterium]